MKKINNIFKNKKFRQGTLSTIITISFIAIVVLINVLVQNLSQSHNLKLDITKDQVFNLTEDSKNYIKSIDKDVKIIVLDSEENFSSGSEYLMQASSVIKQYSTNSDRISLDYVSLSDNPTFANQFPNEDLKDGSIIVKCNDNYQVISVNQLFNIESSYYYGQQITSSKAEQTMTSAIMNVVTDNKEKITFIKEFDEEDYSAFASLLETNNYMVNEVSLLNGNIDPDSNLVVIYAPNRDYDDDAINKLNAFLDLKGKSIIFVSNIKGVETPNLDTFLADWNVKLESGMVFETNPSNLLTTQSPFYAIDQYEDSKYTQGMKNTSIPVTIPFSRPIEILNSDNVATLIKSSETSGVVPANAESGWQPSESDMRASIPLVTMSTKSFEDGSKDNNLCVVGSVIAFDNTFLSRTSLNNSAYFINLFNVLLSREDTSITIEPKSMGGDELNINANQARILGAIFTLIIPIAMFATGITVYVKKRHK